MTSNGVCVPNNDPVSDNGVPYCALAYLTICLKCSNGFTMIKTICILDGVPPILNCKVQTNNKCD